MFSHNFKYAIKTLFKNKVLLFWTFAFPLILGTLFQLAFSDIENSEKLKTIPIAIVENENLNETLKQVFETLEKKDIFKITYTKEEEAKKLLEQDNISGYILPSEELTVVIKENGINQTILKYVVEEIKETESMISNIIADSNPSNSFYENIYQMIMKLANETAIEIEDISSSHMSYTMIEFYTLIAMTCLYGGILGLYAINQILANMSHNGKRVAIAPTKKTVSVLSSALAGYIVQLMGLTLLFIYTIFVLHVDYGTHFFFILLLALVGSLAGLSMGIMIASVFKTNENTKTGIVIALTMLGCFLSGMMGITMKYVVDKNMPIINLVNPASMITDGFYSLYYYDTFDRYYRNIISLLIFSSIMVLISIKSLRRQTYDNI